MSTCIFSRINPRVDPATKPTKRPLKRGPRVEPCLLSRLILGLSSMKVQNGRGLNACNGIGSDTKPNRPLALHVRVPPAVARPSGFIYSANRLHAKSNRHVLSDKVGGLAFSSFYMGNDGSEPPPPRVPNKALNTARRRDEPTERDATSSSATPSAPGSGGPGHGKGRVGRRPRKTGFPRPATPSFAPRCKDLSSPSS